MGEGFLMSRYIEVKKNTTHKQYLYGDFDKDKITNIDDPRPFNPKQQEIITRMHSLRRLDKEVPLSKVLKMVEARIGRHRKVLKTAIAENPGAYGRLKSVPSYLKKLLIKESTKKGRRIFDIAAISLTPERREDVLKAHTQNIEKFSKYRLDVDSDSMFKKPKPGGFRGINVTGYYKGGALEMQFKTKKMAEVAGRMHPWYKKRDTQEGREKLAEFKKETDELAKQGLV
jgi:hypothetical protein